MQLKTPELVIASLRLLVIAGDSPTAIALQRAAILYTTELARAGGLRRLAGAVAELRPELGYTGPDTEPLLDVPGGAHRTLVRLVEQYLEAHATHHHLVSSAISDDEASLLASVRKRDRLLCQISALVSNLRGSREPTVLKSDRALAALDHALAEEQARFAADEVEIHTGLEALQAARVWWDSCPAVVDIAAWADDAEIRKLRSEAGEDDQIHTLCYLALHGAPAQRLIARAAATNLIRGDSPDDAFTYAPRVPEVQVPLVHIDGKCWHSIDGTTAGPFDDEAAARRHAKGVLMAKLPTVSGLALDAVGGWLQLPRVRVSTHEIGARVVRPETDTEYTARISRTVVLD